LLIALAAAPALACAQHLAISDPAGAPAKGASKGGQKAALKGPDAEKAEWARKEREFQKRREARLRQEQREQRAQKSEARQAATDNRRKKAECAPTPIANWPPCAPIRPTTHSIRSVESRKGLRAIVPDPQYRAASRREKS